jgi:hypothetical protein
MRKLIFAGILSLALFSCNEQQKTETIQNEDILIEEEEGEDGAVPADVQVSSEIFQSGEGWGYDIFVDGRKYVHQPYIPAVSGNRPFDSSEDAQKTAELVKHKVKKGIMPPGVTLKELDSLGVL